MWLCHFGIMIGFLSSVVTLTSVWEIQTTKHIRSAKDNKSNHSCQYFAQLESYIL